MRRIIGMLVAGLMTCAAYGERVESLISNNDDWAFSIKPDFALTRIHDESAQLIGLTLGPSLGHSLYVGLAGYGLINSVDLSDAGYNDLKSFDVWYLGADLNYTFLHNKFLHGALGVFVGGGRLALGRDELVPIINPSDGSIKGYITETVKDTADLFVAEPNASLLVNLTSSLELGFGLGYRIVNGAETGDFSNSDLNDVAGHVFLRWTEE